MATHPPVGSTSTPTPIAQVIGVSQRYPGVTALDNVNFEIAPGEVRALLGQNGAGKSTMIRLLSGVETPTAGQVLIDGTELSAAGGVTEAAAQGVATCYQELSLVTEMTVAENFFLGRWPRGRWGISTKKMIDAARDVLESLDSQIDPTAEVASLTLAEQQIVEIARAVHEDPKLLILDEPTSALAASEVKTVLDVVKRVSAAGVAVIYVSHRMDEIRQIADTATVMRNGQIIETVPISGSNTSDIIALMIGSHSGTDVPSKRPTGVPGEVMLEVENLAVAPKVTDVSFTVRAGEIVGIAGLLGSGRTELLRAISGHDKIDGGTVRIRGAEIQAVSPEKMRKLGIGLTPEDRKGYGIVGDLGIDENIVISDYSRVSSSGVLSKAKIAASSEALAAKLSVKAHDLSQPIRTLSGGNQQKAVIARWLHAGSDILLLDEPTRGVDVEAKAQIYDVMRAVAEAGSAVVFVSSEVEELPIVCNRILILNAGTITADYDPAVTSLNTILEATIASEPES